MGNRQNLWLERTLQKYKDKMKMVAIHHHIIPVPDTGADQITVVDAGGVLKKFNEIQSKSSTLRTPPQALEMENRKHASCTCWQRIMRKDERLLLQLLQRNNNKGKNIETKLKIVNGDYVDFDEIVKRREILQESDISQYNDSLAY